MAATIASAANYWINPNALSITLNALGEPNRIQASVASGAQIMCYIRGIDGLGYDNGHNYKRWPLTISPTYFNSNTEKYVYVAIPRTLTIGTEAVVVFPSKKIDIDGYVVTDDAEESEEEERERLGNDNYYYIWLQGIISSSGESGATPREWTAQIETGTLSSDEAIDSREESWYRWDPVTQTVTFLKEIWMDAASVFRNLRAKVLILNGHTLNGVAVKDVTPSDSDDTIVTPAYLDGITDGKYLRKDQDDYTPFSLGVGGDLNVQGIFDAIEAKIDKLRSHNYSGSGLGDTGWLLTSDDGTGASLLEIDKLLVRMKATFMELEIRKETFVGGNNHYSPAGSVIYRVDYMTVDNQPLGYRVQKVPWLLKGIGWLFRMKSYTRQRRIRYAYTLDQLTPEERAQVAKFRCYLISDDGTTATRNWWQVGDQPRCQSFNKALSRDNKRQNVYDTDTAGVTDPTSPISSDFWWRLVTEVGSQILDDGKVYDFIEMPYEHYVDYEDEYQRNPDNFCAASSDIPKEGDTIVCMGNRTDPARMNLISIISVATDYSDAPAVKGYRGIHTFSFNGCLVFNISPEKVSIRSKSFEFIDDSGYTFPVPLERGEWEAGLRYHWYDRVSHNGSIWLCQVSDTKIWVNQAGNVIGTPAARDIIEGEGEFIYTADSSQVPSLESDEVITGTDHYYKRGTVNGQTVYYVLAWTYDEPRDTNANWLKEVSKGTEITDSIIRYNASLSGTICPDDDPTGATHPSGWKTTVEATGIKQGQYLWTRRTTYYSDNRTPTVEYSVARWGIDGDGISEIDSYYWATTEAITMTPAYDEAHILPWNASASQTAKKSMWAPTFSDLETVWGGVGKMQAMYVWQKTVIKYDMAPNPDGTPVTKPDLVSYQCNRVGNDGLLGQEEYYMLASSDDFATVFGSTTPDYAHIGIRWYNQSNPAAEKYRLSSTTPNINTSMWSPLMPAYDKDTDGANIYLWNFEQRVDGTGTQYATRPVCIGNHARGIKGVRELYACSVFGVPQTGRQFPNDIYDASAQHPETDLNVWTDEIYNRAPSEAMPYQWNWTRTLYSSPRDAQDTAKDAETGYFYEDRYHVSAVRGTNGEDGAGEESIYFLSDVNPYAGTHPKNISRGKIGGQGDWIPKADQYTVDDYVPEGWTDNPQGISAQHQFEFVSTRKLGTPDAQGRKTWGDFSDPKLRSNWGKTGIDGDGTEYVFIRTKNNVAPTFAVNDGGNDTDYKSQEWRPYVVGTGRTDIETNDGTTAKPRCTDDPKDVSRDWPYEWVAKRTMAAPSTAAADYGHRDWKSYYESSEVTESGTTTHKMSLWKNFSENSMRLDLTNEMDMVQTDSAGKVKTTRTVETVVRFFDGANEVTIAPGDVTASGATKTQSLKGVKLAWTYTAGDTFTGTEITVSFTYLGVPYTHVFTIGASMGQPIFQLQPSLSALLCKRNATTNILSAPPALSLQIQKIDGQSSDIKDATNANLSAFGVIVRYSVTAMPASKSDGTAWPNNNSVQAANTNDDVYIAMFNAEGTLLDKESVPIVKDGEHGDGIEGITRTYAISAYNAPNVQGQDYPDDISSWAATSPSVTEAKPYLWVKEVVDYKYKADVTRYYYIGKRGDNGVDAKDIEFAYIRTKTNVPPVVYADNTYTDSNGKTYISDDHLPRVNGSGRTDIETNGGSSAYPECTDDPQGVNDTWKYEWEIKRTKGDANDTTGKRSWLHYSGTMTLHNNLAESALVIDIDNDNDQFGVDADGKVLVQQTRTTNVTMLYGTQGQAFTNQPSASLKYDDGTTVPSSVAEVSVENYSQGKTDYDITVTIKATGNNTPVFGSAGKNGLYVDIVGTCAKGGPLSIRFTLEKVMSGAKGVSPVIYQLELSQRSFSYGRDASNNLIANSNSVTVNLKVTEGNTSTIYTSDNIGQLTNAPKFSWGYDSGSAEESNQTIGTTITIAPGNVGSHTKVWFLLTTGDKESVPIVKNGTNGDDAVDYAIVFSEAWAKRDKNGHVTGKLIGTAYKIEGSTRTVLENARVRYGYSNGQSVTQTYSSGSFNSGSWFNDDWDDGSDGYCNQSNSIYASILDGNGNPLRTEYINIAFDGADGQGLRGKVGRFYYFAGEWSDFASSSSWIVSDAQAPYFSYTLAGSLQGYFVFNPEESRGEENPYTKSEIINSYGNPSNNAPWEKMTNDFKYLITEAIFGEFAKFGASIMNGDYLLSQYVMAYGFGGTKQLVSDTQKYTFVDPDDMFGEGDMYAGTGDKSIFPLNQYNTRNPNYPTIHIKGTSYTDSYTETGGDAGTLYARTDQFRFPEWGGNMYCVEIEAFAYGSDVQFCVANNEYEASMGYAISGCSGIIRKRFAADDYYYKYYFFFTPPDNVSTTTYYRMYFKLSVQSGTSYYSDIRQIYIRRVKFVPNFCLNMLSGKLVANDIVAKGELHAESLYYDSILANGNNNTYRITNESIVTLNYNSMGSRIVLPNPEDAKGRVIEIFNGIQDGYSFSLGYDAATTTTYFKSPTMGSNWNYGLANYQSWSSTYLKLWCDGTYWFILKDERTVWVNDEHGYRICLNNKYHSNE